MRSVWFAAFALMIAGCSEGPQPTDRASPVDGIEAVAGAAGQVVTFAAADHAASEQFGGSFTWQQNAQLVGEVMAHAGDDGWSRQTHDLSHLVPVGQPVFITVETTADVGSGDIDAWLDGPFHWFWTTHCDCPLGGHNVLESALVRDSNDPLTLVVQYDEVDDQPGFDYVSTVTVAAPRDILPSGIPVAIPMQPGDELLAESPSGSLGRITIYDPNDAVVATLDSENRRFRVAANESSGEYVLLGQGHGSFAALNITSAKPGARILNQGLAPGDPVAIQHGGSQTVPFHSAQAPIQAGGCASGDATYGAKLKVVSPGGDVASFDISDEPLLMWGACAFTAVGDESLTAGDYQLIYQDTHGEGGVLQPWLIYYDR